MTDVFIKKCGGDIERNLPILVRNAFSKEAIDGKTVFLKPNWVNGSSSESGVTTDIHFIRLLGRALKEFGAKRVLAGDGSIDVTSDVFQKLGVFDLEKDGIEVVNLDEERTVNVETPFKLVFEEVMLPESVIESDIIISVPKIKTHETTLVTLSIKNFYGFLTKPQKKAGHMTDIHKAIMDIYSTIQGNKVCYAVVDGLVGLEGRKGPTIGNPVKLDLLIASKSPLACDFVCSKIMRQNPYRIIHLAKLFKIMSFETEKISVVGEEPHKVSKNFDMPLRSFDVKSKFLVFLVDLLFRKTTYLANEGKCALCQNCVRVCPMKCISLKEKITFDYTKCVYCLCCVEGCGFDSLDYKVRNEWLYKLLKR